MSEFVALGLLLQLAAAVLVLLRVGRRWLDQAGTLFILVACVYHGACELAQSVFPDVNPFRRLVSGGELDRWILIPSCGILLFAVCYVAAFRRPTAISDSGAVIAGVLRRVPDWRLTLLLALPALWIRISGQEYGYWARSLSDYLSHFALLVAGLTFVLKRGQAAVVPVLLVQSLLLTLSGARTLVVVNGLVFLAILMRLGMNVRFKRLAAAGAFIGLSILTISAARTTIGRLDQLSEAGGVGFRAAWAAKGLQSLADPEILAAAIATDFIYRIDGNSFNAMVNHQLENGVPPAGLQSLWNNFILMVPSAFYPSKLESPSVNLFEENYTIWYYNLPQGTDYIQGVTGVLFSYYGTPWFLLWMSVLGWVYARMDRWLGSRHTPTMLLASIGWVYTALFMEFGILVYFMTFRSLLVLYLLLAATTLAAHLRARVARSLTKTIQTIRAAGLSADGQRAC